VPDQLKNETKVTVGRILQTGETDDRSAELDGWPVTIANQVLQLSSVLPDGLTGPELVRTNLEAASGRHGCG
jgi:hypothetical protein